MLKKMVLDVEVMHQKHTLIPEDEIVRRGTASDLLVTFPDGMVAVEKTAQRHWLQLGSGLASQ